MSFNPSADYWRQFFAAAPATDVPEAPCDVEAPKEVEEPKRWKTPIGEEHLDELRDGVKAIWDSYRLPAGGRHSKIICARK